MKNGERLVKEKESDVKGLPGFRALEEDWTPRATDDVQGDHCAGLPALLRKDLIKALDEADGLVSIAQGLIAKSTGKVFSVISLTDVISADPVVARFCKALENCKLDECEQVVHQHIKAKSFKAAAWHLSKKGASRGYANQGLQDQGDGGQIVVPVLGVVADGRDWQSKYEHMRSRGDRE